MERFLIPILLLSSLFVNATNIYVDSESGNDSNSGTSIDCPIRALSKVASMQLSVGDSILLRASQTHKGTLEIVSYLGNKKNPLVISSYGNGNPAHINAQGYPNGILLKNSCGIVVRDLLVSADAGGMVRELDKATKMRCGILILADEGGETQDISIHNVTIKEIYYEEKGFTRETKEVVTANGTQSYGWGIRAIKTRQGKVMGAISITDCDVSEVSHTGIKFTGSGKNTKMSDVRITNCSISDVGGPGMQFSCVENAYIANNKVLNSGSKADSRNWGRGSGMWTWSACNFLVEHNSFIGAKGPGDSAGAHIDYNCNDIVLQFNFSTNNAGGFIEILGNCHNCAYRYNISVNDGFREKDVDGAFQEGKILWLSGFVGENSRRNGPYNSYIYNNTIYVSKEISAKMALENTVVGALIANNIFYIEDTVTVVPGDQYNPEKKGESEIENVWIKNNLYLHSRALPKEYTDAAPLLGTPVFHHSGGLSPQDYIPKNKKIIRRGIAIRPIPGDSIGLKIGLEVKTDFLGNPIKGNCIGAIAL